MKTVFSDFIEAEEYLRKHLDLPEKVKFRSILKTNVVAANEEHPALIDIGRQYPYAHLSGCDHISGKFAGISGYGEQLHYVHLNQTMVLLVFE